jgi:hypothetical protein
VNNGQCLVAENRALYTYTYTFCIYIPNERNIISGGNPISDTTFSQFLSPLNNI